MWTTREIEESSKPSSYFYEHFVDLGELGMTGLRTDLGKPRNLRRFENLACAWRFTFINAHNHYSNKILTKIVSSQVLDHITWRSPKFSTMTGWARSFFAVWGCPVHGMITAAFLASALMTAIVFFKLWHPIKVSRHCPKSHRGKICPSLEPL